MPPVTPKLVWNHEPVTEFHRLAVAIQDGIRAGVQPHPTPSDYPNCEAVTLEGATPITVLRLYNILRDEFMYRVFLREPAETGQEMAPSHQSDTDISLIDG